MSDPRPNNEPGPRVLPQQSSQPIPGMVLGIIAIVLGVAWLVIFVARLSNGGASNWLDTWWPLITGIAFVLLGVERLRRASRR